VVHEDYQYPTYGLHPEVAELSQHLQILCFKHHSSTDSPSRIPNATGNYNSSFQTNINFSGGVKFNYNLSMSTEKFTNFTEYRNVGEITWYFHLRLQHRLIAGHHVQRSTVFIKKWCTYSS
jgi:hypothetical protein